MKVGFIGLGIMGHPMALNIGKGGHELFLFTRSGVPQPLLDAGGTACGSPKEVAERAEVIITMVPDTPQVEEVLFAPNGVAAGLSVGQDRDRHELDLAAGDQGLRQAHQRAGLRLSRRPGLGRRGRAPRAPR